MNKTNANSITVATANTYFGKTIRTTHGLTPLKHADVILFQEVFTPKGNDLTGVLSRMGFTLAHASPRFGLAIAVKNDARLKYFPQSVQEHRLARTNVLEHFFIEKAMHLPLVRIERGVISCQISVNGRHITIATTHPTTPIASTPRARYRQVKTLGKIIAKHYAHTPLILGGDMNHYHGPSRVDRTMHTKASLIPIDIGNEPTWYVQGSKQERLLTLASKFLRRPLEHFNGQHDIILYRKEAFLPQKIEVVDIPSDHRSVVATLQINGA